MGSVNKSYKRIIGAIFALILTQPALGDRRPVPGRTGGPTALESSMAIQGFQSSKFLAMYQRVMADHGFRPTSASPYVLLDSERCPASLSYCIRIFRVGYNMSNGSEADKLEVLIRIEAPTGYWSILNLDLHHSPFATSRFIVRANPTSAIQTAMNLAGVPISDDATSNEYHTAYRASCVSDTPSGSRSTCRFEVLTSAGYRTFTIGAVPADEMVQELYENQVPFTQLENGAYEYKLAMLNYTSRDMGGSGNTNFLIESRP